MDAPNILVINSCGKAKRVSDPHQPSCDELQTEEQRKAAISRFSHLLTPARDLYIGPQAKAINKAVNLLKKQHSVDLYIISAGFGLVSADTLLPPYECSFSNKGKKVIQQRADELGIPNKLKSILEQKRGYDLVYLALGHDYLHAIGDLRIFNKYASKIILFGKPSIDSEKFEYYNTQIFVNNKKSNKAFAFPIGATIAAKGTILHNYAYDLFQEQKTILDRPFSQWWKEKVHLLRELEPEDNKRNISRPLANYHSHLGEETKPHYNYLRGKDYIVGTLAREYISKLVRSKFSDTELLKLAECSAKLSTLNAKKGQNKRKYVNSYKEYHNFFIEIRDKVETIVCDTKKQYPYEKLMNIRGAIIESLYSWQKELGCVSPINEVKYAVIRHIVGMLEDPTKLHTSVVYSHKRKKLKKLTNG